MVKVILVLLFMLNIAQAQTIKFRNYSYLDTDANVTMRSNLGYYHEITSRSRVGVHYGKYSVNRLYRDEVGISFLYEDGNRLYLERAWLFGNEKQVTYKIDYLYRGFRWVHVNWFSERDIVDHERAVGENLAFNLIGGSLDFIIVDGVFTVTMGYAGQIIENIPYDIMRDIYMLHANVAINDRTGINIRNRMMYSDGRSTYFFQPNVFNKHLIGGYRSFVSGNDNMLFRLGVMGGVQNINHEYKAIYEVGVLFRGWINERWGYELNTTISNAVHDFDRYGFILGNVTLQYRLK